MTYQVRDTQPQDLLWLAENMRKSDRLEIMAQSGSTPADAMFLGRANSEYMKTALCDGVPVLVFGVAPSPDLNAGIVWMLATDLLQNPKARRHLARHSREWVEEMQSLYPVLMNITDARNSAHHKWLKFCGFKFIRKFNHGTVGAPFIEFVRIQNHV